MLDPNPAPLAKDIPAAKPKCCGAPLVVSIRGHRWRPRAAFVLKSNIKEGMLSYVLSDKPLTEHQGCTELYPVFDRNVVFFAKPGETRIEIDPALPLLLDEYQGDNKNLTINAGEGQVVLTEVTPDHVRGTLQVDYSRDSWAIGSFEAKVCPDPRP